MVTTSDEVCRFWQEFDLDGLRAALDQRGLDIAARQETSLQSRKELASYTKEFKKNVSVDIFKEVAPLLKKYQIEVDALTQRSKQSEAAFLDVFQKLQDAPDPSSTLAESLDAASKIAGLESKLAKVTSELNEYEQESKELKNQDFTIRKLEEKIRAQQELLEEKDQEIEEARSSAAAELEARSLDEARVREERLEKELSRAKDAFETMKKLHASTQAQLVAVQERGEEVAAAAQSESQLAMIEVERAEQRLGELIKERDALLEKVQSPSHRSRQNDTLASESASEMKALRDDLKSQREFVLRLREELEESTSSHKKDRDALEAKIANMQMNLEAKESHILALEAQLSSRPRQEDLQESRKQIRMLKAILQNSTINEDEDDLEENGNSENSGELNISSMESALLQKNQKLESSLTLLRMQLAESNESIGSITSQMKDMEDELTKKIELIRQLEEHLESATKRHDVPDNNDVQAKYPDDSQSIVQALSAQRDRLKSRINELEGEISSMRVELNSAKEMAKSAKEDNITLVERLKYVEGYMSRGTKPAIDIEKGGDSIEKYMKEYEKKMNPFTDFRAKAKEAQRRKLPIHDRAAYAVGSAFVSGSKIARSAIITYVFALHFVAFIVIAGFSHRHTEKMDALESLCHEYNLQHQDDTSMGVDPVIGAGSLP